MQIKLSWISVRNFKKLTFRLDAGGDSILLAGRNGTGKTTLASAFFWLMTDSDYDQQTRFNLLELQKSGDVIDNQDAVVEAELFVGSKTIRLRKEYKQKWVKKRGSIEPELATHTTDHFFDGVPVKKGEFAKKLAKIIDPEIVRSIADVHHFCSRLKWEKRRETLMMIAGDISDRDICEQLGADELYEMLEDKTPDDVKKMLKREMKEIEKALDDLPGRIDELHKMIPDVGEQKEKDVIASIATLQEQIDEKKREILATRSGLSISEKERQINELKIEVSAATQSAQNEVYNQQQELMKDLDKLKRRDIELRDAYNDAHNDAHHSEMSIVKYEKEKSELVQKWTTVNALSFVASEKCFACGQALPIEAINSQRDEFNLKKAGDLEPIDERGRWLTNQIKELNERIEKRKAEMIELKSKRVENENKRSSIQKQIKILDDEKQSAIDVKTKALNERIAQISDEIKIEMQDMAPAIESLENEISEIEKEKAHLESVKLDFVQIEKCNRRIKERTKQQREYGAAHEEVKRKLQMLDDFSEWKSNYIEQHVNDKFELCKWTLFERYQHGGHREICEATYEGVPYSSDLNTGARINIGIDVIRTLQRHYDVTFPIWIDNAESVTEWMIEDDQQTIKLAAAPNIEKLEVIDG